MENQPVPYAKQIFVCTYNRNGESASCGDHNADEVFAQLRKIAKDRGLHPNIRVAQAKCLGKCNQGVNIMSYPDNTWHCGARVADVEKLAQKYF